MILMQYIMKYKQKTRLNRFWTFVTFQYRGFNHLEQYCSLIIEEWLKLNMDFDKRYLELWTALHI